MTGYAGTSNVLAGKRHGIPVFGTMAHSFVTSFESELEAFRAYATAFPDTTTLLVDTYDTLAGVRNAITVAGELAQKGHALRAVRLDSGDLLDLSRKARRLLDEAGFGGVRIVASGSLDEYAVDDLLTAGAPIDGFGVGTKAGVSADAPWSDCVYKLAEYDGRPVLKLSPGKSNLPGHKQVYRYRDGDGNYAGDVIASADEPAPAGSYEPLLRELMSDGRRLSPRASISEPRCRFAREFASLPGRYSKIRAPDRYDATVSPRLEQLERSTAAEVLKRVQTAPMQDDT
jgi:nicotinate phosphoribosyltransferase